MGETMPDFDEILRYAKSLEPADRLRIIARLWASLPQETWPKPTQNEKAEADRRLTQSSVDQGENVPWPIVEQIVRDCVRSSRPLVYSAPRRFDLATIFVVTTAYALLFAELAALQLPPLINLLSAGFIAIVGIGQAFLFRGLRPRTSSLLVGMATCGIFAVGHFLMNPRIYSSSMFAIMLAYLLASGAILGYVAGAVVGGVFLVADFVRRWLSRTPPTPAAIPHIEESPFSGG
jgi:putative addiction module component (TIGR02574 family)